MLLLNMKQPESTKIYSPNYLLKLPVLLRQDNSLLKWFKDHSHKPHNKNLYNYPQVYPTSNSNIQNSKDLLLFYLNYYHKLKEFTL